MASPNSFRPREGRGRAQGHAAQERRPWASRTLLQTPGSVAACLVYIFLSFFIFNCTILMHFPCKKKNLQQSKRKQKKPPLGPCPGASLCGCVRPPGTWTRSARPGSVRSAWAPQLGSLAQRPSWKFSTNASGIFHWVLCCYFQTLKKFIENNKEMPDSHFKVKLTASLRTSTVLNYFGHYFKKQTKAKTKQTKH